MTKAVNASQKIAGRFVTVDEHPGKGTLINVADTSARRGSGPTPPPETCCGRDITEISAISVILSIDADFHGTCGTGTRSDSFTWNFSRISKDDTFDCVTDQFQLYLSPLVDGCCSLVFVDTATHCSSGVYAHDWGKVDSICADGDFRFPQFVSTFDDDCNTGTVDLLGSNVIGLVEARFGGDDFCNDASCGYFSCDTGFANMAEDIPITNCDMSGLIGTYTLSNVCTDTNADVTVTVEMTIS